MPRANGGTLLDRRTLLGGAIGLAGSCAAGLMPRTAASQQVPATEQVSGLVSMITGLGGNIVVFADGPNAIVVDSGAAEHTEFLVNAIQIMTAGNPLTTLFNTHWHRDQVGGNAALRGLGAEIIAHEKTLAHLSIPFYQPDQDRYQQPLPPEAHPTETFVDQGSMLTAATLNGENRRISYGYLLEAHTDGDIYVHFENDNVIAAGDAISPERDPEIDWYGGGWLGGRVDSLKLLLDISDADTRFVPSYGPVVDRGYVQAEHDLMQGLFDILFERVRAGESAEDIDRSGALDALPRRFDDPAKLLYAAHKSVWGHYNTLSHDIV